MPEPTPSRPEADRNLLFGILALQMDFVTREALIQAMNAWVLDKTKPLGQILLEQGALQPDTLLLLDALVQKHLELHGQDTQHSLAALSSLGSVRKDLEQVADPDVQASLRQVSVARSAGDDSYATRYPDENYRPPTFEPSVGTPTSSGLRFRILRPHAKGGLGQVSVALDAELNREVALKEIQPQYANDPESRARFLLEAEITGGLEHPGIVPVHGLGSYADGRPFYAMRFIKGDSLQDAIRRFHVAEKPGRDPGERTLALRELLGRFVDVCQAVAYAHSRGVLHRDLKPGNVMLGRYGETLLVDWGLAKPLGRVEEEARSAEGTLKPASASGATPTQMGAALGTPAYMSPEQAAGSLDQLGPASDVYSLGATLYCLLTGQAPVGGPDVGALLHKVVNGEYPAPHEVQREVPPALEAICLKAMALKPEQRYRSPRALADEIEHWLADEPVGAYAEALPARLARWGRRHRSLVASAAVLLASAVVGLSAGLVLLEQANRRTEAQRQRAEQAAEAEKQARASAEKRLAQVEKANELLGSVFRDLDPMTEEREGKSVRVLLGERLDRAARELDAEAVGDPRAVARMQVILGKSLRELGHLEQAAVVLEKARGTREALLGADHPDTLASKNELALLYHRQGKYDRAEPLLQQVLQASTALFGADHSDTQASKNNLALLYQAQGKYEKAEPLLLEVLQAKTAQLGADDPDTLASKNNLALLYYNQGRYEKAEPLLLEVLQVPTTKLGADHPGTLTSKHNLAGLYRDQGKYEKAEPLFQEVLQARTAKLGADHPDTLISKNDLALLYHRQGKYEKAEPLYQEILQVQTVQLGADHPYTLISKNNLAGAYKDQGKYDRAEPLFQEAVNGARTKLGLTHPWTQGFMNNLADCYTQMKEPAKGEPLLRELAAAIKEKAGAESRAYAVQLAALGTNLLQQSRFTDAEAVLRECLAIREKEQPDDWSTFNAKSMLGASLVGQKHYAAAEPLLVQGYEGLQQRRDKVPPKSKVNLTEALGRLVQLYDAWGKPDQATKWQAEREKLPKPPEPPKPK
jgi:serine/threonine protein kinase/lipopolysaccharide biosynthesis regulator YciM